MTKTLFIVYISILLLACNKPKPNCVKYSGVYATNCSYRGVVSGSKQWLRFFPDGKVASALTFCDVRPENLVKWFNIDNTDRNFHVGIYSVNDGNMRMSFLEESGSIEYSGIIQNEVIEFRWESSITGSAGDEEYHFIEIGNQ